MATSIHDFFQIKDAPPDPKGSLSVHLPSQAIARLSSSSILAARLSSSSILAVLLELSDLSVPHRVQPQYARCN